MTELVTKDPYSHRETGIFHKQNFDECGEIIGQLNTSQQVWKSLDIEERLLLVREGLKYFEEHRERISQDICEQMGRPLAQCNGEVNGFFERANYLCDIAVQTLCPNEIEEKEGFERQIHHEPLGTIFVISAWNYPLLITVNSVIPALIAGNTVLLKHSSLTPKLGAHFEKAFSHLGDHKNLIRQVVVDHETTGEIIEKLNIDHVVFTGSVPGGQSILNHTRHRFMMPAMELGGKDAAYVDENVDLKQAVETIVDGAMFNSGQSCCGIERVYVHEAVYKDFIEKAKVLLENYKLGDPKESSTSMGPLAQAKAADIMTSQVQEALSKGAKLVLGGQIEKINDAVFFQPTLIKNADHSMEIMQEENFGPIMAVMMVGDLNQAIDFINDSKYGLTASIFTISKSNAEIFFSEVNTGTVFMNRCDYLDPALPWTGVKDSGCGSALSSYGFYNVTRRKAKHFKLKI
ncbi:MAG: aldehyde dehydrogenase family protein [Bdellovibrionaceae bacterium]|jgi:acyl-CoA reductase-like NAD-dependent aldehyde dehydrogenase|nr:aldehyde dehydrogenase family protein [Pseudobdellovibrionaceae bacterium]